MYLVDPTTYDYSTYCETFKKCHSICCVSIITNFCMDVTDSSVLCFIVRLLELRDCACSDINMHSVRKNTEDLLV